MFKKKYQRLRKDRNGNRTINGINIYECEEQGKTLASCSLERTRLEEIIIEVSKTLLNIEKGEREMAEKQKRT